jgi:Holliday junction resolvasome RuvABC endonuclease subunit
VRTGGVLSLDLSRNCGWVYGTTDLKLPSHWGCWLLPQLTLGERLNAFRSVLVAALDDFAPSLVFMEAPLAHFTTDPLHVVRQQYGLAAYVEGECCDRGIRCAEQEHGTIRLEVLGRGQFPKGTVKDVVIRWAKQRGIETDNDNIADACVGWEFCVRHMLRRELELVLT